MNIPESVIEAVSKRAKNKKLYQAFRNLDLDADEMMKFISNADEFLDPTVKGKLNKLDKLLAEGKITEKDYKKAKGQLSFTKNYSVISDRLKGLPKDSTDMNVVRDELMDRLTPGQMQALKNESERAGNEFLEGAANYEDTSKYQTRKMLARESNPLLEDVDATPEQFMNGYSKDEYTKRAAAVDKDLRDPHSELYNTMTNSIKDKQFRDLVERRRGFMYDEKALDNQRKIRDANVNNNNYYNRFEDLDTSDIERLIEDAASIGETNNAAVKELRNRILEEAYNPSKAGETDIVSADIDMVKREAAEKLRNLPDNDKLAEQIQGDIKRLEDNENFRNNETKAWNPDEITEDNFTKFSEEDMRARPNVNEKPFRSETYKSRELYSPKTDAFLDEQLIRQKYGNDYVNQAIKEGRLRRELPGEWNTDKVDYDRERRQRFLDSLMHKSSKQDKIEDIVYNRNREKNLELVDSKPKTFAKDVETYSPNEYNLLRTEFNKTNKGNTIPDNPRQDYEKYSPKYDKALKDEADRFNRNVGTIDEEAEKVKRFKAQRKAREDLDLKEFTKKHGGNAIPSYASRRQYLRNKVWEATPTNITRKFGMKLKDMPDRDIETLMGIRKEFSDRLENLEDKAQHIAKTHNTYKSPRHQRFYEQSMADDRIKSNRYGLGRTNMQRAFGLDSLKIPNEMETIKNKYDKILTRDNVHGTGTQLVRNTKEAQANIKFNVEEILRQLPYMTSNEADKALDRLRRYAIYMPEEDEELIQRMREAYKRYK